MFKWYLARVEKENGKDLKCLRSDRGGEFTSNEFEMFCNDKGNKRKILKSLVSNDTSLVSQRQVVCLNDILPLVSFYQCRF